MRVGGINTVHVLAASITLLSLLIWGGMCDEDKTKHDLAVMYTILHDVALPNFDDSVNITERFILLSPGQVLDSYDYTPLNSNEPVFIDPSRLPPDENAFRLSDAMPTLNPLGGGTTGKTLSTIYSDIIYTIDTTSIKNDPFKDEAYIAAMAYLQEGVSDPANTSAANVSRMELYQKYKVKYNRIRMDVQNKIRSKTKSIELEYEKWYKATYNSLQDNVSAAYSQWLVHGLKGEVEDKLSIIDIQSLKSQVEKARNLLQAEALPSRDGASIYYPVHYIPSNWYNYLHVRPDQHQLTYDQLNAKIADLVARRTILTAMKSTLSLNDTKEIQKHTDQTVDKKNTTLYNASKALNCYRYRCLCKQSQINTNSYDSCEGKDYPDSIDYCKEVSKKEDDVKNASVAFIEAQTQANYTVNELKAYNAGNIQTLLHSIDSDIANYTSRLATAPKVLPPIAAEASNTGAMTQEELDNNWLSFSYDSETSNSTTVTNSKMYKSASSFIATDFFTAVSGGASYSRAEQDFAQQMSAADTSISAKVLRVTFSRSWFTPSIFQIAKFKMQEGVEDVSPGPMLKESDYVNAAINTQLPEYTTGFLLAKDVSMRFRGISNNATSHALQESASTRMSFRYGPFTSSTSFNYGHDSSKVHVSAQSNGLQIDIPGAQIIGYYTSVLPKFPADPRWV